MADEAETTPPGGRLPRGRHGLRREEVQRSQRERILWATAEAMCDLGYVDTSVAQIIKRAGVSRETFYEQFDGKLDCFLAAFDAAVGILMGRLDQAVGPQPGAPRRGQYDMVRTAVSTYLDTLAANPGPARLFLVEVYAAGLPAMRRRAEVQALIATRLAELLGVGDDLRFTLDVVVAGIGALVAVPLVEGDLDRLRSLSAPIEDLIGRSLLRPIRS